MPDSSPLKPSKKDATRPADHAKRVRAAEERAAWELGSRAWAGVILAAYWNPYDDAAALEQERRR